MNSETLKLWREYKSAAAGSRKRQQLRDRLAELYLPTVRVLARKIKKRLPRYIDLNDLIQDGSVGMIMAMESFDPKRGADFKTYASLRIRGAMLDSIREMDWLPRSLRRKLKKSNNPTPKISSFQMNVHGAVVVDFHSPDMGLADADTRKLILSGLNDREAALVQRYDFDGFTTREAGEELGISESSVSHIRSGLRRRLRANQQLRAEMV